MLVGAGHVPARSEQNLKNQTADDRGRYQKNYY